jgi:parvulin-like peptidyl-prolyl isomerase
MQHRLTFPALLLAVALPAFAQPAPASTAPAAAAVAPMPPDAVLADNGVVTITRADVDRELERLSPELRSGFATTERRVADLVSRMLLTRTLAAQADASGLTREPENAARLAAELVKVKAQLRVAQLEAQAGERFEQQRDAWEKRAKDIYLTQPARSTVPEKVTASHILFRTERRSVEEATRLAQETRAKIVGGRPFGITAAETTEDFNGRAVQGSLPPFARGEMDPAFEKAAFALAKGELSQPVVSNFGVHLILVSDRTPAHQAPYDSVKPRIMADLRQQFIGSERDTFLSALQAEGRAKINMDLVRTMVIAQPPEAELMRIQREQLQGQGRARPR